MFTYSSKDIQYNKKAENTKEVEQYFPGFLSFIDSTEQQIPRPVDKRKRKHTIRERRKDILLKTQLMVNNHGIIIHKSNHKKGHRA